MLILTQSFRLFLNASIHILQDPPKQKSPPLLIFFFSGVWACFLSFQGLQRGYNLLHVVILY